MHPQIAIGETKELHWWDNMNCNPDLTMNDFVDQMAKGTVAVKQALKKGKTSYKNCLPKGTSRHIFQTVVKSPLCKITIPNNNK